uniref:Uncharacterized protein n=1 Tax=Anguilla anguilla TaxID=7936 RepID=A0A0E9T3V4_ANGAN
MKQLLISLLVPKLTSKTSPNRQGQGPKVTRLIRRKQHTQGTLRSKLNIIPNI